MYIQLQKLRKKLTLKDNKTTIKPGTQIAIMLPDAHNEKRAAEKGEGGGMYAQTINNFSFKKYRRYRKTVLICQ